MPISMTYPLRNLRPISLISHHFWLIKVQTNYKLQSHIKYRFCPTQRHPETCSGKGRCLYPEPPLVWGAGKGTGVFWCQCYLSVEGRSPGLALAWLILVVCAQKGVRVWISWSSGWYRPGAHPPGDSDLHLQSHRGHGGSSPHPPGATRTQEEEKPPESSFLAHCACTMALGHPAGLGLTHRSSSEGSGDLLCVPTAY